MRLCVKKIACVLAGAKCNFCVWLHFEALFSAFCLFLMQVSGELATVTNAVSSQNTIILLFPLPVRQ